MPKHDLRLYAKWNINLITINHTPSILAQDIILNVGDNFDPLNGISTTDYEDGDLLLTATNIIANNVDTSKPGKYYVTYKVVDTQNASCIKTINVYVNDNILPPTNNNPSHQGTIINPDTGITTPNHNVINNSNKITKENLVQNNKDILTHKIKIIQTSVMSQIIVLLFLSFIILSILVILNRKNR